MRSAVAAQHLTFRVPTRNTLPPPISLSGHSPIREANAEALRNFVKIGTNLSKQSSGDADVDTRDSGEIEAEERFSSDRRTLSADGRLGWFWEPRRSGRLAGEAAGTPPRIGESRDRNRR